MLDDSTGITVFDFSDSETMILSVPSDQSLSVSYYNLKQMRYQKLTQYKILIVMKIVQVKIKSFGKIDSDIDNSCIGMGSLIDLIIEPLPV